MKLKLQEIIWEITSKCANKCSYCGSKEVWNAPQVDNDTLKKIIDNIASYPPLAIDISGGDPLLVDMEIHQYLVDTLKAKGVCCKILVNPKSMGGSAGKFNRLKLYDHIGVSVNTEEELELSKELSDEFKNITYITNFNQTNLYLVDTFAQAFKDNGWQIQFTMGGSDTIYDKPKALEFLNNSLSQATNIIIADNANRGVCGAGTSSLGILHNGLVVPCLSMRSWCDSLTEQIQGDLTKEGLKNIWQTKFHQHRFEDAKSCKDICDHKCIIPSPIASTTPKISITDGDSITIENAPYPEYGTTVTVYAVSPMTTLVYGVPIFTQMQNIQSDHTIQVNTGQGMQGMQGMNNMNNLSNKEKKNKKNKKKSITSQ